MQKIYGKNIDLTKLKPNVLRNLKKHLAAQLKMINYLSKHYQPIKQNRCYICNSKNTTLVNKIHGFTYVKCANCGHNYTTKRFTDTAIKEFYKNNKYYSKTTYANKESCYYRRDAVAKPKVEFTERFAKKKGLWLDVGAGIGDLVSIASKHGWKATGIELSTSSIAFGKQIFNANLEQKSLEQYMEAYPKITGKLKVVSMIGLLEHVTNPMALLNKAWKLLDKDGLIMVQVPSADSLTCMIQTLYPQNVFRHMNPVEHIMLFSRKSLITALEKIGFEPLALWFHGMDFYELLNNMVMNDKRVGDSNFYKCIYANMNELQFTLDKKELSDRIICVAKKLINFQ